MGKPAPDRLNNSLEEDCEEAARSRCPVPCSRHCQAPRRLPPRSAARKTEQHSSNQPPAPAGSRDRDFDTAGARPDRRGCALGRARCPARSPRSSEGRGENPAPVWREREGAPSESWQPREPRAQLSSAGAARGASAGSRTEPGRSHGSLGGFLGLGTEPAQDGNTATNSTGTRCCTLPMKNSLSPGCDSHPVPTPK